MADATKAQNPNVRKPLTQERLKELLHYDPETGIFTNRVSRERARAGAVAGSLTARGRLRVKIDFVEYMCHRLAWLYMTGEWPDQIDHADRDQTNNRWNNLREADASTNGANKIKLRRGNPASPLKGVYWNKRRRKWDSRICCRGKRVFLGTHPTEEQAHAAYREAAILHFGEFARSE